MYTLIDIPTNCMFLHYLAKPGLKKQCKGQLESLNQSGCRNSQSPAMAAKLFDVFLLWATALLLLLPLHHQLSTRSCIAAACLRNYSRTLGAQAGLNPNRGPTTVLAVTAKWLSCKSNS